MTEPPAFLSRLLRKKPVDLLARDMSGAEEFTNAFDEVSKRLAPATAAAG